MAGSTWPKAKKVGAGRRSRTDPSCGPQRDQPKLPEVFMMEGYGKAFNHCVQIFSGYADLNPGSAPTKGNRLTLPKRFRSKRSRLAHSAFQRRAGTGNRGELLGARRTCHGSPTHPQVLRMEENAILERCFLGRRSPIGPSRPQRANVSSGCPQSSTQFRLGATPPAVRGGEAN